MSDTSYGRRWKKWLLIYVGVAAVLYLIVYLAFFANGSGGGRRTVLATPRSPYGHGGANAPHSTWSSSAATAAMRSARDVKERPPSGSNDGTSGSIMVVR